MGKVKQWMALALGMSSLMPWQKTPKFLIETQRLKFAGTSKKPGSHAAQKRLAKKRKAIRARSAK